VSRASARRRWCAASSTTPADRASWRPAARRPRRCGLQGAGPVCLLVDDAQWADRPSLEALLFALRRLQADRALAVVISRSGSTRGHLAGVHRLIEHGHGTCLRLRGLDAASIRQLGSTFGMARLSSRAADRIRAHTGGNPLHAAASFMELAPQVLREPSDLPLPSPRARPSALPRGATPGSRTVEKLGSLPGDFRGALA
jgi:hypothetical protein